MTINNLTGSRIKTRLRCAFSVFKSNFGVASCVLLFAHAFCVSAHDYWVEPEQYVLKNTSRTTPVTFHLHVGDEFRSEQERPLQLQRIIRFALFARGATKDLTVAATDGQLPMFDYMPDTGGTLLFAMERTPQRLELAADKFNSYLTEEGLSEILRLRASANQNNIAGRERYTRFIKMLMQVGPRRTPDYKRITGQRLEIIPQLNPYSIAQGASFPVKILFENRPLIGARVAAYHRNTTSKTTTIFAKTDSNGVARFKLNARGAWLVRLVHMRPCESCADADWESFWGACTFSVGKS